MALTLSSWQRDGLASGLSAALLSLLVLLFMTLGSASGAGPILALETASRDVTFRTAVALYGPIQQQSSRPHQAVDPILFLDIDEAGCEALISVPQRCRIDGVVHQEIMVFLARELRASGAKAIVIDTRLPDDRWDVDASQRGAYFDAWLGYEDTPIIAAQPGAPGKDANFTADDMVLKGADHIQFAPAVIWTSGERADNVIRRIDRATDVRGISDGVITQAVSTLPFAVLEALDTDFQRNDDERIFYTLPSTVEGLSYQGDRWERRQLSRLLTQEAGAPSLQTVGFEGQIVIIGSSAAASADRHMTPLGPMAGPEVIANIIRDVQLFPVRPEVGWLSSLLWKLLSILPGMVILIATEMAHNYISHRALADAWPWWHRYATKTALWSAAFLLVVFLTFRLALDGLLAFGSFAIGGDLFLPIFALFLEEFVRFSSMIVKCVQHRIKRGLKEFTKSPEESGAQ